MPATNALISTAMDVGWFLVDTPVTITKTCLIHSKDTIVNQFFYQVELLFFALSGHWENVTGQLSPPLLGGPTSPLTIKCLLSPYEGQLG